ncbi:hypothetical protein HUJ05_007942 [Dendroctonus ponderosae]|nr:hypothetical protein HUJ05_007942 [Dendroctonus ponderosae]
MDWVAWKTAVEIKDLLHPQYNVQGLTPSTSRRPLKLNLHSRIPLLFSPVVAGWKQTFFNFRPNLCNSFARNVEFVSNTSPLSISSPITNPDSVEWDCYKLHK